MLFSATSGSAQTASNPTTPTAGQPPTSGQPASDRPSGSQPAGSQPSTGVTQPVGQPAASTKAAAEQRFAAILARPGGLTAAEAAKRAAETSLDVKARNFQIDAAKKNITRVIYGAAPRLTLTARYTRLSEIDVPSFGGGSLVGTSEPPGTVLGPDSPLLALDGSVFEFPVPENNYFLNANVTVPLSDYVFATGASLNAAESLERVAELDAETAGVNAATNAKIAYYTWVQRELETVVAKQSLEQAQAQLKTIENNFKAGLVAEADVLSAKAFVASSELLVRRSQTNATLAQHRLRLMMHEPAGTQYLIGEDLLADFSESSEKRSLEQLYQEAATKRPEMRALSEQARSLQSTSDVQRADTLPVVELFGNVTYANPNPRIFPQEEEFETTWDVGIQAVWSINDWGSRRAEQDQTLAQKAEVIAQRSALYDSIRVEVQTAYASLTDAQFGVETAQRGLEAAEAAHRSRTQLLQYGRATSLELVETETSVLRARLELINAHVQLRIARVQLDHAVGRNATPRDR